MKNEILFRWLRRSLAALLSVAAVAALITAAFPGAAREVARGAGTVAALQAHTSGLVWLEAPESRPESPSSTAVPRRLLFLRPGAAQPTTLAEAPDIADFSLADAVYYVTTGTTADPAPRASPLNTQHSTLNTPARGGALWRVPFDGGAPVALRTGLQHPTAVVATSEWVCWTETEPRQPFSLPVLPLTRPRTTLRAMPRGGGDVHTLAVIDGEAEEGPRLVGAVDGALHWMEQRKLGNPATLVKRARLPGASTQELSVETLASEEGTHEGLVAGRDSFYWIGASREGAPARAFASVNRLRHDGQVALLAEWLPTDGVLRADGGRVYFCRHGVYELPGDAGAARKRMTLAAPGRLTQILRGHVYSVESEAGQGYLIMRRPLHWAGRWAARWGGVP